MKGENFIMNKYYPTYLQTFVLFLIFIPCILISVLLVLPFASIENGIGLSLISIISMLLTVTAGLALRKDWRLKISLFPLAIIFLSVLFIIGLHILLDPLNEIFPAPESLIKVFRALLLQPYAAFFYIVISAPILEEVLFRGIILDGYLKNYKPWQGIIVSAFLFALIHGNLAQGLGAFGIGILFGWVYWKTNSIIPSIILHFINNAVAFVGMLTTPEEDINKSIREFMDNNFAFSMLYAFSIIIAVGSIWILHKKYLSKMSVERAEPKEELTSEI